MSTVGGAPTVRVSRKSTLMSLGVRVLLVLAVLAALAVGASGCGAGGGKLPVGAVAAVGGTPITTATFQHWLAASAKTAHEPVPDPPLFKACIAHLQTASPGTSSNPAQTEAQLKDQCQQHYDTLRQQALEFLITTRWVLEEAKVEGAELSDQEAKLQLENAKRKLLSNGAYESLLRSSGHTFSDFVLEFKRSQAESAIRHYIASKEHAVTAAEVASYYAAHQRQFAVPERRDLKIIRTASRAAAIDVKREIESGKSFASVVKQIKLAQPIFSHQALVRGLRPGLYSEKPLDRAIFTARPNALSGPVKIYLGYYIFEVKKTLAPKEQSLAEVRAAIASKLPEERKQQATARFIKAWRARWIAKTTCRQGYIINKCSEYKDRTAAEDPYTLN